MAQPWHGERFGWWQNMKGLRPPVYVCPPVNPACPPDLNGDIAAHGRPDGPAWEHAPWTSEFADIEGPLLKPAPRFKTRAKMMWDESAGCLWVGTYMYEPHLYATLTEKNSIIYRDDSDFEIFLNPSGSTHRYYEYEVNAKNTIWELFLSKPYSDNGQATLGTNLPSLQSHVWLDGTLNRTDPAEDKGWALVVKLPFSDLRDLIGPQELPPGGPRPGDFWRINFSRVEWQTEVREGKLQKVVGPPEDNWVWSPQGIINMHRPEMWGFLLFSDGKDNVPSGQRSDTAVPDPLYSAKHLLMEVYHYQVDFKQHFKSNALNPEQLGISKERILQAGVKELTFSAPDPAAQDEREREDFGFIAKARVPAPQGSGGAEQVVCVRGDSLIWVAK